MLVCMLAQYHALRLTIRSVMKRGSTHQSTSAAPKRGRPRRSTEVREEAIDSDSDDVMDLSESEPLVAKRTSRPGPTKKVMKAVAIKTTTPTASTGARRRVPSSQSPSSVDSVLSSTRDHSIEYDTPGTSTAVTPAEMSIEVRKSLLGSKRKRHTTDDVDADARLAEALQAEEYEGIKSKPNKRSRLSVVKDSDDDESILSDLSDEESLDSDMGFQGRKPKPAGRASLPSRQARNSAKKTITSLHIDDSEEESVSEFSELNSDDFDDESESESDTEDIPTIAAAVATLDSTVPNTEQTTSSNPTRRPRRPRRRRAPGNAAAVAERQESWRRRRIAGLNYRVSYENFSLSVK